MEREPSAEELKPLLEVGYQLRSAAGYLNTSIDKVRIACSRHGLKTRPQHFVARELGIPHSVLRSRIRTKTNPDLIGLPKAQGNNYTTHMLNRELGVDDVRKLAAELAESIPLREVSDKLGIHYSTAWRWARAHGKGRA